MPHNRFFASCTLDKEGRYTIAAEELPHVKVLRPHIGDAIELIDGKGSLGKGTIVEYSKTECIVHIDTLIQEKPPQYIKTLILGLLRPNHLEYAIEKSTEVGIDAIHLFCAHHSEKKEFSPSCQTRLNNIIKAATKQSGRLFLPELNYTKKLNELLCNLQKSTQLYYGDHTATTLYLPPAEAIAFCIGPESGLTIEEKALLRSFEAQPILLAKNTLRAETAAIIASYLIKDTAWQASLPQNH